MKERADSHDGRGVGIGELEEEALLLPNLNIPHVLQLGLSGWYVVTFPCSVANRFSSAMLAGFRTSSPSEKPVRRTTQLYSTKETKSVACVIVLGASSFFFP